MGCERPNDGGDGRESQIPLRILLSLKSFSSGDIFSGGTRMARYVMLGNYSKDREEEEVPWMNNEEESWEGKLLGKIQRVPRFPNDRLRRGYI